MLKRILRLALLPTSVVILGVVGSGCEANSEERAAEPEFAKQAKASDEETAIQKELQPFYTAIEPLWKQKNFKAIGEHFATKTAPGFQFQESYGALKTIPQMEEALKLDFSYFDTVSEASLIVRSLKLKGEGALAIVDHKYMGEANFEGKKVKVEIIGSTQDQWERANGQWKLTKQSWIGHRYKRDSVPFEPPKVR